MPQDQRDYYSILGVLSDATPEEIKRAYYTAAQRLHPDKNKVAGETEIFLEVQQAYEVLSNPKRRARYDATRPKQQVPLAPVQHNVQYSRPSLVRLAEPQLVYVLLEVGPRQSKERFPAPPLNLCLLIDRSTSMQGNKIDVVKTTAMKLMSSLRPEDIFSLVTFSDRAEVLIPAGFQSDRTRLQRRVQMIQTNGGTEIYQGLQAALQEVRQSLDPARVNHIILLTDGHTYGDEEACLELAEEAAQMNIGISGLGIGGDWNDIFLDTLAARSGSNSSYISKPQDIQRLLVEKFRALANVLAEDVTLEIKTQEDVKLNFAFRLQPEGGPITLEERLHLGPILQDTHLNVLFEFMVQPSASKADVVTLLDAVLKVDISARPLPTTPIRLNLNREVAEDPKTDVPPPALLNALARLSLYRLQERAHQEVENKNFKAATRHLKNLASLLLDQGEKDLAKTAMLEAENMEHMQNFSEEGSKEIKYGTRSLLLSTAEKPK